MIGMKDDDSSDMNDIKWVKVGVSTYKYVFAYCMGTCYL
jgi:hypothetical protein